MTSYPTWRRHQIRNNWKSLVSIFLTVTLLFAVVNGLAKGISLKDKIAKSKWDGKSPIAIVVNSLNPSVFIYQDDPKKLTALSIDRETYVESNNQASKLSKLSSIVDSDQRFVKSLSLAFGTKFENYADLEVKNKIDELQSREVFKNFASIATPFKILAGGYNENIKNTNITRVDAFRLWWHVKSLSVNDVYYRDLTSLNQEILDEKSQKVLGADSETLNKEISKYTENLEIIKEGVKVAILNRSGDSRASNVANNFVKSVGAKVVSVSNEESRAEKTQIIASDKSSITLRHLAKIFDCDINDQRESSQDYEIIVVLGQDFANYWLE